MLKLSNLTIFKDTSVKSAKGAKGVNGTNGTILPDVKQAYSNGSITGAPINISEEVNKTTIWKQLTENSKAEFIASRIKAQQTQP